MPRFRFTLGRMMIVVAAVALTLNLARSFPTPMELEAMSASARWAQSATEWATMLGWITVAICFYRRKSCVD